ncbi:MAG: hypothetical protein ACLR17_06655 [Enterobacteriaceae bacterium]
MELGRLRVGAAVGRAPVTKSAWMLVAAGVDILLIDLSRPL